MSKKLPAALLKRIAEVKSKRPKTVRDRIVANGSISTDELKEIGYNHAPRAARDVRELGIQLKTTMVKIAPVVAWPATPSRIGHWKQARPDVSSSPRN